MNFLKVEPVAADDGIVAARLPDGALVQTAARPRPSPPARRSSSAFRAEHCVPGPGIPATVDVVEHLGERTLVYARLGDGAPLVYQDDGDSPVRVGDGVTLSLRRGFVHLFDASGRAHHAPGSRTEARHG